MLVKQLAWATLLSAVVAQNLTSVLSSNAELSNLTTFIKLIPSLVQQLSGAKNITLLAPSNDAFQNLLASPAGAAISVNNTGLIQALLTYHVLTGTYPASSFGSTPAFIPTLLSNQTYANVTGGQRVEGQKAGSSVNITSGLKSISTVTKAVSSFDLVSY